MRVRSVHDRDELAALLGRDPNLHAYQLGDLDDHLWPYTTWYRLDDAVALIYHRLRPPILMALSRHADAGALNELLADLSLLLPRRCHAHLTPAALATAADRFTVEQAEPHLRMALTEPERLDRVGPTGPDGARLVALGSADLPELRALLDLAYPGNSFASTMLDTGPYLGVRHHGELVAAAGTHVWSRRHRVAALANVVTRPDRRGRGLASALVAALCRRLLDGADHLVLNVRRDNAAAVALYRRLGFTVAAPYVEATLAAR